MDDYKSILNVRWHKARIGGKGRSRRCAPPSPPLQVPKFSNPKPPLEGGAARRVAMHERPRANDPKSRTARGSGKDGGLGPHTPERGRADTFPRDRLPRALCGDFPPSFSTHAFWVPTEAERAPCGILWPLTRPAGRGMGAADPHRGRFRGSDARWTRPCAVAPTGAAGSPRTLTAAVLRSWFWS